MLVSGLGLPELAQLLDRADQGVIELDPAWNVVHCSPAAERILRIDGAGAAGRPFADVLRIDDRSGGIESICRAVERDGTWRGEVRHGLPEDVRWAELSVHTLARPGNAPATVCLLRDITAFKAKEGTLREQERRYRLLAENARDVIWTADLSLKFTYVSPSVERLRGFTPEEAMKQTLAEVLTPAALQRASQTLAEELALEMSPQRDIHRMRVIELEERHKNGSTVQTEITLSFLRNEKLEVVGVLGVTRDVTERNRAVQALRRTEERYRITAEQTGQVFFEWDIATGQIEWSGAGEHLTGQSRLEFRTLTRSQWEGWVHPEDRARVIALMQQAMATPGPYSTEYRFLRKDGSYAVVEAHGVVVHGDASAPSRMLGTVRDISERKRLDDALRESQRAMTVLIHNLPGMVYRCRNDRDWTMEYLSPACEALTGYPTEALIGNQSLSYNDLIEESHREQVWEDWQRVLQEHGVYRGEYAIRRKDGALRWVWEQGCGVYSESGDVLALEGFISDITERKLAEQERSSLEEQLRQSQKMEAIGQLAGGVAHDFNNILTCINGFTEMLMSTMGPSEPIFLDLLEVKKAADRAASLTSQLLAFSRKQVIAPRVMDLNTALRPAARMIQRIIGEDVELRLQLDDCAGRIKADPGQIEQILINLAVNARDALADGGKVVLDTGCIRLDEEQSRQLAGSKPGAFAFIGVADNGCGMTPEVREHIFEPFFTTKAQGKGTGLGLSTVYGIVQQNGGFIDVHSEPGVGSTFRIFLPSVPEEVEAPEPRRSSPVPCGRAVILLVEDEEMVRKMILRILERQGYTVMVAHGPMEAIAMSEQFPGSIDLLLSDVVMPELNGRQLHARLEASRPGLRVLYMSGYPENALSHEGVLEPGIPFLAKPFAVDALLRKLGDVLGG
ncbi:MAG: PAS domain S-box protein [Deltaproteobacteria bacterium]|nr:PAS domain S-box protein [Deltaproteobacteria bacterium]